MKHDQCALVPSCELYRTDQFLIAIPVLGLFRVKIAERKIVRSERIKTGQSHLKLMSEQNPPNAGSVVLYRADGSNRLVLTSQS